MKDQFVINQFKDRLSYLLAKDTNEICVEDQWMHFKTNLPKANEEICGISKYGKWHKQTWCSNNSVNDAVNEKKRLFRVWKKGGSKEEYILTKKVAKQTESVAKKKSKKKSWKMLKMTPKPPFPQLYR